MGLEWEAGLFGIVLAVIALAFDVFIVVLGVVIAWRWLHRPDGYATLMARSRGQTALEILDERYARGEIDAQEYEERRERLLHRSP